MVALMDDEQDPEAWTDLAGAARAAQCREETIAAWIKRGYFTPEEAYQLKNARGRGYAWCISVEALARVAKQQRRSYWLPELARPQAPVPPHIAALLAQQKGEIERLTQELETAQRRSRLLELPPLPSYTPADYAPPAPVAPRPRVPHTPLPHRPRAADQNPLPDGWLPISTYSEIHNVHPRTLTRHIGTGRLPQPHRAPDRSPWHSTTGQACVVVWDTFQLIEVCPKVRAIWPDTFTPAPGCAGCAAMRSLPEDADDGFTDDETARLSSEEE